MQIKRAAADDEMIPDPAPPAQTHQVEDLQRENSVTRAEWLMRQSRLVRGADDSIKPGAQAPGSRREEIREPAERATAESL